MHIECDRYGKVQIVNETHMKCGAIPIRTILDQMRHDGCGGRAGKAELLTGIEKLTSATPKIPKHRITPPVAPNGIEQGKVHWHA
jgi:hypothetical protein